MNEKIEEIQSLSLCRLCLSYTTRPISLVNSNKHSVMLEALTTIRVLPTDDISTVSCLKCLLNLKLAFHIQQNILKSEQRFREHLLSEIKQEFLVEDEILENIAKVDTLGTSKIEEYSNDVVIKKEIGKLSLQPANFETKQQDDSYVNDICNRKEKKTKILSKIHKKSVHQYKTCTICNMRLKRIQLGTHTRFRNNKSISKADNSEWKEAEALYGCDNCGVEKRNKILLRSHNYNVNEYTTCTICKKRIIKNKLKIHMELHNVESESVNDIDRETSLQQNLSNEKSLFVCEICGLLVQHLENHIFYNHQNGCHKCKFCDKIFEKPEEKASHELKDHNGEQTFICNVCGKKFYFNRHLKVHVERVHSKQKSFSCQICNVDFSSKYSLQAHNIRKHINKTRHKCEICGDRFSHKILLKSHVKSKHQADEKLTCKCKKCGKTFTSKATLIIHGRIHKKVFTQ